MSHKYIGTSEGFIPTKVIYNPSNDVNGFIGYLPSDNSIYVAFRGTESLENWMIDFDSSKTKYNLWPECDCEVHAGFNSAVNSVINDVISEITRLSVEFPTY
jgi:hypothetical protein